MAANPQQQTRLAIVTAVIISILIFILIGHEAEVSEANAEDVKMDIESRLLGGRGGLGLVDESLPEAIKEIE